MKKYLLLPLIMFTSASVYAGSAKIVTVPFQNQAVISNTHDGLYFEYNLKTKPTQEIVCTFQHGYKTVMLYRNKGQLINSGVPGDKFILTSKGDDSEAGIDPAHKYAQLHVDAVGAVKVSDWKNSQYSTGILSCHYEFDDNPLMG